MSAEDVKQLKYQLEKLRAELERPLPAFTDIHVHDGVAAQSIATGATYTKLTAYTDNGHTLNLTPDAANDKITITKTGYYHLNCSLNFMSGSANIVWHMAPFLNGVEEDEIHVNRKTTVAGDVGGASMSGVVVVNAVPVDLDIRARHDSGGAVNITVTYSNLNVVKIAPI